MSFTKFFNSLPKDTIFDFSKLKAFADDKLKFVSVRVENIVGNRENAGYQYFLLLPQFFQKNSFSGSIIVIKCVVKS